MPAWLWSLLLRLQVPVARVLSRIGGDMTLTEFLWARIADDVGIAEHVIACLENGRDVYDLRRVARECEAKARIVRLHAIEEGDGTTGCYCCSWTDDYGFSTEGPCDTLLALAAIYADHVDYEQRWKP